jgi:hypothetical protein
VKKLLGLVIAIFVVLSITPMAYADLKIIGWGITQYISSDAEGENPYFTNSKIRVIVKGGSDRAKIFLQFSGLTKEGDFAGVPHKAGFLDCKLHVDLNENVTLTAGRFCVPFGLVNAHSTYNLPVGLYSPGIRTVLAGKNALRATGVVLSGKVYPVDYAIAYTNAGPGQHKNKLTFLKGGVVFGDCRAGVSILNGKLDDAGTNFAANGIDLKYSNGPFRAEVEYATGKMGDTKKLGYYVQGSYDITNAITLRVRYDVADPDTEKDNNETNTTTIAGIYSISDNSYAALIQDIADTPEDKVSRTILQLAVKFTN